MSQTPRQSRRQINAKAVLILLGSFAALVVSVHFLHGFQVKRNARDLLDEATRAEQSGDARKAIDYLSQYLGMVRHDTDAHARYALLLEQQAKTPKQRMQAFFVLEEVLRQDGEREEVRRRAVDAAMKVGRFNDAAKHLEVLHNKHPDEVALEVSQAHCELISGQLEAAGKHLEDAAARSPDNVSLQLEYALLLREKWARNTEADRVMDDLIKRKGNTVPARLAAARYARVTGRRAQAEKHLEFARNDLKGQDADLFLLSAEVAAQDGNRDRARAFLETGTKLHPKDVRLTEELVRLDLRQGRRDEALRRLRALAADLPSKPGELWMVGNLLIDAGDLERGRAVRERLEALGDVTAARFLQARLLMSQESWGEARNLLEKVRAAAPRASELRRSSGLLLGECYRHLFNPDQQVAACKRVLAEFPASAQAQQQLASALAAAGKREEALAEYRKGLSQSPALAAELASLLLDRNLSLPKNERSWTEVNRLVAQLQRDQATAPQGRLLEVRILAARGEPEAARSILEDELKRNPQRVEPWLMLMALAGGENGNSIPALLEQAEQQAGPRVEWDLVRTRYALRAQPEEARKQLARIEARVGALAGNDQDRLRAALAAAYAASGDEKTAERLWRQLAERQKNNLATRFLLFESAMRGKREDKREGEAWALVEEMRAIEGGSGPWSMYAEAALRGRAASQGDREAFTRACSLLEQAASLRPSWPRVPLLQAILLEKDSPEEALKKYQAAIELGEDRVDVVKHVVRVLASRGHLVEANTLLRKLPETARQDLGKLAAELTLLGSGENDGAARIGSGEEALKLAKRVAETSKDYHDHLWLGRIAAQVGDGKVAEKALRQACEMAPTKPESWVSLILYLAEKEPRRAEAELEKAAAKLAQEKGALAPCYEALGKLERSEKEYQAALEAQPKDTRSIERLAGFYVRTGQRAKADPLLRSLIDPQQNAPRAVVGWARRALALNLAVGGSYARFKEAQSLLSGKDQDKLEEQQNLPVRALVLATRPEHRSEAIRMVEGLPQHQLASMPELQFVLAELHEQDGSWDQAKGQLLLLLKAHPKNPRYLAFYLQALLRHDQAGEAAPWLERLQALLPDAPETLALQARVLHATGSTEEAKQLVLAFADKKGRPDFAAGLLEQIGLMTEAEKMLQQHVQKSKEPGRFLLLAAFLTRRGRVAEALQACDKAAGEKAPPLAVLQMGFAAVSSPRATEPQRRQVEQRLQAVLADNPSMVVLTVYLAELQQQRGNFARAVKLYRDGLEKSPQNAIVMNNLAYLLALTEGDNEEALRLIQAAIEQLGPDAELLDTRALVHLAGGRAEAAIADLKQVVVQAPSATKYFHLFLAWRQLGKKSGEREAQEKAQDLGFRTANLPLVELRRWQSEADKLQKVSGNPRGDSH